MTENLQKPLKDIINTCERFINGSYDLPTFQQAIASVNLPKEVGQNIYMERHDTHSHLERIFYSFNPENHQREALPYVKQLLSVAVSTLLITSPDFDPKLTLIS